MDEEAKDEDIIFTLNELPNVVPKKDTEPTIPLSVIEGIKAEIERESDYKPYEMYDMKWAFNKALSIIDKAVKEYTHDKG